jgi:polysaccharide export outer membrane protein
METMRRGSGRTRALGLALAACLAVGCAARSPSPPPPDPVPMARETYVIGVMDGLRVTVWKNPELSVDVPVRPDGKISVPLIGDVQAEGLTPEELAEVIARELEEYVNPAQVTVVVREMNSQYVSVMGEVARTARVPLRSELRVLEAITLAGGFGQFANKSNVRVVRRQADGSEVEYRFDYDAYIAGAAPGTNIVLQHGDMVIVPD